MDGANLCPECKVPLPFTQGLIWLNNGDIVQRASPQARAGFIECENLDPLFKNVGDIIGMPIEPQIVNITARGIERYMKELISEEMREMIQEGNIPPDTLIGPLLTYCHIVGYGQYEFIAYRYRKDADDYSRYRVDKPFSVPEVAGTLAGTTSAAVGGDHAVTYEEVSPDTYEFTTHWTRYPEELAEMMPIVPYRHRDGDLEIERCASCGGPAAFSGYKWRLDRGIIVNQHTGRRMALLGPELLDQLFRTLENELGEAIPQVVVEAQRRFTKTGFYSLEEVSDEGDFRTQLAIRGMGNLREIRMGMDGMLLRIDNAAGHLLIVGMAQGLFEMALDVESRVEWELSEWNDLVVEIRPRRNPLVVPA